MNSTLGWKEYFRTYWPRGYGYLTAGGVIVGVIVAIKDQSWFPAPFVIIGMGTLGVGLATYIDYRQRRWYIRMREQSKAARK